MGFLTDLLKDVPLSAVLKERLAEADAKYATLNAKHEVLDKENTTLRQLVEKKDAEIADLNSIIKNSTDNDGVFV